MIKISNLTVSFSDGANKLTVLKDLNYTLKKGEVLAVVGESGCGKTVHALSLIRLLPSGANIDGGEIIFEDKDILKLTPAQVRRIRGAKIAMIFQDPMTSLNPSFTVQSQIAEAILAHQKIAKEKAIERAQDILQKVGIEKQFFTCYPHQLSGGMRQRVMIAIALCCNPEILIADEPTTALDVTVQAQILQLIKKLQRENNMTVIFITHNLAIVDDIATRVIVLYGGQKAEEAPKEELLTNPLHPYTKGLLGSVVTLQSRQTKLNAIPGAPPLPGEHFEGCNFEPRCPFRMPKCKTQKPPVFMARDNHQVRCWMYEEDDSDD